MTDSDDILDRSAALDRQILAIPADQVFTKRAVTIFGTVIVALQLALMSMVLLVAYQTNRAVTGQLADLQHENAEQEELIADYEAVLNQAVDAVITLSNQIVELGGTPPEIVLRPPDR